MMKKIWSLTLVCILTLTLHASAVDWGLTVGEGLLPHNDAAFAISADPLDANEAYRVQIRRRGDLIVTKPYTGLGAWQVITHFSTETSWKFAPITRQPHEVKITKLRLENGRYRNKGAQRSGGHVAQLNVSPDEVDIPSYSLVADGNNWRISFDPSEGGSGYTYKVEWQYQNGKILGREDISGNSHTIEDLEKTGVVYTVHLMGYDGEEYKGSQTYSKLLPAVADDTDGWNGLQLSASWSGDVINITWNQPTFSNNPYFETRISVSDNTKTGKKTVYKWNTSTGANTTTSAGLMEKTKSYYENAPFYDENGNAFNYVYTSFTVDSSKQYGIVLYISTAGGISILQGPNGNFLTDAFTLGAAGAPSALQATQRPVRLHKNSLTTTWGSMKSKRR